jgi:glucokinase
MTTFGIGVDLGGTNLRIAAIDEDAQLLEKITLGTKISRGRDDVIDAMCVSIQQLARKYARHRKLAGIGVGVAGIIDLRSGKVRGSPNLPGWIDYPVRAEIEHRLKTAVVLENDANVAALGEKWLGAGRDYDDMAMITLGTGVGGALVLNGRIWHGMNGMAGEFGHATVEPAGPPCNCGNRGCLEQYASATAVVRMAREAISSGHGGALSKAAKSDTGLHAHAVYDLAIQGDPEAQKIFRQVGRALGIALASMVNALNLPIYVVGGGVSSAWELFAPSIFEELKQRSMVYAATAPARPMNRRTGAAAKVKPSPATRKTIVTRAVLGSDAGLFGAARLPMMPK